jgi:hypothetical protein
MNLAPRKLTAAHALLVDLLSAGPVPVADCLERAAEVGISERTLYEARRRLPIEWYVRGRNPFFFCYVTHR